MRGKQACWTGFLLAVVLVSSGESAWVQRRRSGISRVPEVSVSPFPSTTRSLSRKMLKASYEELQKDVQRLSDLSAQLQEQVTKTDDEDVLSLAGVKKAEEIEKLAKKIQNRMKNL